MSQTCRFKSCYPHHIFHNKSFRNWIASYFCAAVRTGLEPCGISHSKRGSVLKSCYPHHVFHNKSFRVCSAGCVCTAVQTGLEPCGIVYSKRSSVLKSCYPHRIFITSLFEMASQVVFAQQFGQDLNPVKDRDNRKNDSWAACVNAPFCLFKFRKDGRKQAELTRLGSA